MTSKAKVVRLSKAAREFNIALDTVVDFLSDKGFDVIKNPNTKLDPEMYAILQDEFQTEKELKKASKERNLEFLGQGPISITGDSSKDAPKEEKEEVEIPQELFITNHGVSKVEETPKEEVKPEIKEEKVAEPVAKDTSVKEEKTIEETPSATETKKLPKKNLLRKKKLKRKR